MKFSYLHYSTYKNCPLQYKWRFVERPLIPIIIDKRNAFIGLLLQKITERFYREHWWQEKDPIARMKAAIPIVSDQLTTTENIRWEGDQLKDWLTIAHDTMPLIIKVIKEEKLLANPAKHQGDEQLIEYEVEIDLGDDQLQSRPDFIIKKADIITLLDGKGGKTVGRYVDEDQLFFYSLSVKKLFNRLPHRVGFWWFRHSRIVWIPLTNASVDTLLERVKGAIKGVKEAQFQATPGDGCRLCDFQTICTDGMKHINSRRVHADIDIPSNFGEVSF